MSKRIEEDSALLSVLGYGTAKPEEPEKKPAPKKKAAGSRAPKPKETENRTRRVQLVLPPTLYDQLKETAWKNRQSVNEAIIQAVTEYLKRSK